MQDWYEVSLSPPGEGEWDEPVFVLAVSFIRAAEERLKEAALYCDDYLESEWDAHVQKGDRNWYVRLQKPLRRIVTYGTEYHPSNAKGDRMTATPDA